MLSLWLLWLSDDMKLLATVFVVLAMSQVEATFPEVADDDGMQINFVTRLDNRPAEQALYNYAKFLQAINQGPGAKNPPPSNPTTDNKMAEEQNTKLCPFTNCTCDIELIKVHGFIKDENGNPTDNCTIHNVPYCRGVCSSTYRYSGYIAPYSYAFGYTHSVGSRQ